MPDGLKQWRQNAELTEALRQAIARPESGIRVIGGGAIELPRGQSNARIYLVQSGEPISRANRD
ncbi:MAG: hypothetical protein M3Y93_09835 [Pseudomonadota bacterium]|nr:hypothetical protein [Pseudomonadota bacterium]